MESKFKVFDSHVHTHFAYCSRNDMFPDETIKIAKSKNYGICIVEHAGQLYVKSEDFWNENIVNKPKLIYDNSTNRMDDYINYVDSYKERDVKLGLEVDMNSDGKVTLRPEHAGAFEIFLGAVHYIHDGFTDIDKGFMWNIDAFCDYGVDMIVHPFRIYKKKNLERPVHLYSKVAKALARSGVAAEINFHTNEPDPEFFRICIEHGVKIALGSDAHCLAEVCEFDRNFDLLSKIYTGNTDEILYVYE